MVCLGVTCSVPATGNWFNILSGGVSWRRLCWTCHMKLVSHPVRLWALVSPVLNPQHGTSFTSCQIVCLGVTCPQSATWNRFHILSDCVPWCHLSSTRNTEQVSHPVRWCALVKPVLNLPQRTDLHLVRWRALVSPVMNLSHGTSLISCQIVWLGVTFAQPPTWS
jgi:hypothetical protein